MKAAACLLAVVALLWPQADVRAECGGDGGAGSGGDSGSDGGGDSEPACEEVSPIVGHAICNRFGSWDAGRRPPIRIAAGASVLRVPVGSISLAGTVEHTDAAPMSFAVTGDRSSATGGAFELQVTAAIGRHLYGGVEGSIGGLTTGPMNASTFAADLGVKTESLTYMAFSGVAGAAVSLGDYQLRGDIAVGARAIGVSVQTTHDDCVLSNDKFSTALLVRPRVSAQRWVTPWVSLGASAGTNLTNRGETTFGLFVGGHLRAFDAGR